MLFCVNLAKLDVTAEAVERRVNKAFNTNRHSAASSEEVKK
jgi:hypothetical protein